MKKEAIEEIAQLAIDSQDVAKSTIEIEGRRYTTATLHLISPPKEPQVPEIRLNTLTGFVDWYNAEMGGKDGILVHVTPGIVSTIGPTHGPYHQRDCHAVATASDLAAPFLGQYITQEEFVIGLLTRFLDSPEDNRSEVLKYIGTLTDEKVKTSMDDGVSQMVTVRAGIAGLKDVKLPNVVKLTPRRTFAEIGGIPELFVLRVREGSKVALISADTEAWKLDATAEVAKWLREKLPGAKVIA